MTRTASLFLMLAMVGSLSGCWSSDQEEIQEWMKEQRAKTTPKVQPLPEPKKYTPQAYEEEHSPEPFASQKLAQAFSRDGQQAAVNPLIASEFDRRKQPLESFPLDAMTMVGSLAKKGQPVALILVDKLLYKVKPGEYIGQNYGRITAVSETEVVLRELVQDAAGEWIERNATLQLQERSK